MVVKAQNKHLHDIAVMESHEFRKPWLPYWDGLRSLILAVEYVRWKNG